MDDEKSDDDRCDEIKHIILSSSIVYIHHLSTNG